MDDTSKCRLCNSKFRQNKNLYAHMRKFHKVEPFYATSAKNFICDTCYQSFSCQSSLARHTLTIHKEGKEHDSSNKGDSRKKRLICPYENCEEEHKWYDNLRQHLVTDHEVEIQFENLTFDSMTDFEKWREKIQQETLSLYTKDSGSKPLKGGKTRRLFMNCHRSYCYKKRGKNLRALKSSGSNKIGKACPSRLEVTINDNDSKPAVSVIYWRTHYGHTQEIERMTLNKDIRLEIAEMLEDGVSFDEMLEGVQKSEYSTGISPRLLLLDRKDMHNIVRDFNIDKSTKLV